MGLDKHLNEKTTGNKFLEAVTKLYQPIVRGAVYLFKNYYNIPSMTDSKENPKKYSHK